MIRKIYGLLCTMSLIIALPAFGMETYPCDLCEKEKTDVLKHIHIQTKTRECDHILCQRCNSDIYTIDEYLGLQCYVNFGDDSDEDGNNANSVSDDDLEIGDVSVIGNCVICSRMQEVHNKQCWKPISVKASETFSKNAHFPGNFQEIDFFTKNPPNRVVPSVTPKRILPTNTPKKDVTYPCDVCEKENTKLNYKHFKSNTQECDHILCDNCLQVVKSQTKVDNPQDKETFGMYSTLIECDDDDEYDFEVKGSCSGCMYMQREKNKQCWKEIQATAQDNAMDSFEKPAEYFKTNHAQRVLQIYAYPCDNCKQEHPHLMYRHKGKIKGIECNHILCKECRETIKQSQQPINDKVCWDCKYCSYFYNQKAKQCWYLNENETFKSTKGSSVRARDLRNLCPNRILLDVTNKTSLPQNPNDSNKQQNHNNQQTQNTKNTPSNPHNPDNPPTNNIVIDNKIQWFAIAGIGLVVCYGAYKVYQWWKTKYKKENGDEIDESDNQTREGVETLEV